MQWFGLLNYDFIFTLFIIMSYNINGIGVGIPTGTIFASAAYTTDPLGYVIADGVARDNDGRYNNLINLGIGSGTLYTGTNTTYTPINLNAAFLRSTGSQTINSVEYSGGTTIKTYQHTATTHTHPATSTAHNHATNTTNATDYTNSPGALGMAISNGVGKVTNSNIGQGDNSQVNVKYLYGVNLNNAAAQTATSNNHGSGEETAPFCYGVNWLIKL